MYTIRKGTRLIGHLDHLTIPAVKQLLKHIAFKFRGKGDDVRYGSSISLGFCSLSYS